MAEAKKAGTPRARKQSSGSKKAPEALTEQAAAEAAETNMAQEALPLSPPERTDKAPPRTRQPKAPLAEPMQFSRFGPDRAEKLRQAMSQAAATSAHGALEINGKILTAIQSQGEAAIDLWRSALHASHPTEALNLQAAGTRHAYEAASAQWKDIAETTARWFNKSLEPLQAVFGSGSR